MAYPTSPVTFPQNGPGEHRSDAANLLGTELTAIETATLHSASQSSAKMRLRQTGNQVEWGPATAGRLSVLANTGGKSYIGLGCSGAPTAGEFRTWAQPGIVLTHDNAAGLLVQSVPLIGTNNQPPVTRLTIPKTGFVQQANPVIGSWSNPSISVVGTSTWVATTYNTTIVDPHSFYSGNATGDFVVPAGLQGTYLFVAQVNWQANATGNRMLRWLHVATGFVYPSWAACDADGGAFLHEAVLVRYMVAGERVNFQLLQSSGVTLAASCVVRMLKLN